MVGNGATTAEYLNRLEQEQVIESIKSQKHKVIILLMMDGGLRVSEAVSLKFANFDFQKKLVFVKSLKKRKKEGEKEVIRKVPISDRLYRELAEYVQKVEDRTPESYVFTGTKKGSHLSRFAVSKYLSRLNDTKLNFDRLNAHKFRHTCATNLIASGSDLNVVKTVLGHASLNTTTIYTHLSEELLSEKINTAVRTRISIWDKFKKIAFKEEPQKLINIRQFNDHFLVGRDSEIKQVQTLLDKRINVIIIGGVGVGKNHLLHFISAQRKVLKLEDLSGLKKSLISLLVYLYSGEKEQVAKLLYPEISKENLIVKLNKTSTKAIIEEIQKAVEVQEYILYIDNIERITPAQAKSLELLKDTFTIVTTARSVRADNASFLWNFEVLKMKELGRKDALELIRRYSSDLLVNDYELFKNHVFEQTNGNPRAIKELIDRFYKEPIIDENNIRTITHTGALQEYDFTTVILLAIAGLAVFRYLSAEVDNSSYRFIGGAAMLVLLFATRILRVTQKKFL